ncbi:hypothetical protein QAD02_002727 [Eretmocerus hayati]|uniref:Uncharacterized protein n=1 Tax=Eretmocerus hayati TaxID=131215 RepID=A0ACC2NJV1_9HYME|nr:hypothetical protein QAD02_002727 [Eretmocerus hayati]
MAPLCKGFAYPVSILMSAVLLQMEISTALTTVPVILWNQAFITTSNSPFHETSKEQFQTQLNEVLGKGKPPILLFVKDDLCYEDMQLSREVIYAILMATHILAFEQVEYFTSIMIVKTKSILCC